MGWWTGYHRDVARPLVTAAATPAVNARRNAGKAHGFGDGPYIYAGGAGHRYGYGSVLAWGEADACGAPSADCDYVDIVHTGEDLHVLRRPREVQPRRTPQPHLGDVDVGGLPIVVHGGDAELGGRHLHENYRICHSDVCGVGENGADTRTV